MIGKLWKWGGWGRKRWSRSLNKIVWKLRNLIIIFSKFKKKMKILSINKTNYNANYHNRLLTLKQ
jgi:hypothetical protein